MLIQEKSDLEIFFVYEDFLFSLYDFVERMSLELLVVFFGLLFLAKYWQIAMVNFLFTLPLTNFPLTFWKFQIPLFNPCDFEFREHAQWRSLLLTNYFYNTFKWLECIFFFCFFVDFIWSSKFFCFFLVTTFLGIKGDI